MCVCCRFAEQTSKKKVYFRRRRSRRGVKPALCQNEIVPEAELVNIEKWNKFDRVLWDKLVTQQTLVVMCMNVLTVSQIWSQNYVL